MGDKKQKSGSSGLKDKAGNKKDAKKQTDGDISGDKQEVSDIQMYVSPMQATFHDHPAMPVSQSGTDAERDACAGILGTGQLQNAAAEYPTGDDYGEGCNNMFDETNVTSRRRKLQANTLDPESQFVDEQNHDDSDTDSVHSLPRSSVPYTELPSNPTIKDMMNLMLNQHTETSSMLNKIDQRLNEYEKSLEFAHAKTLDNEKQIKILKTENIELHKLIGDMSAKLDSVQQEVSSVKGRQDAAERHSREWCMRVYGVSEPPNENTRLILAKLMVKHKLAGFKSVEHASQSIEHCHRLGPVTTGKHRAIIAHIFSRPVRNLILKDARPVNNDKTTPVYFAADMIKSDHALKIKAKHQMKTAYENGKKVTFRKGELIIDSVVVPIDENPPMEDTDENENN